MMEDHSDSSNLEQTVTFEEGKPCPVKIKGHGGGLSISSGGDALLIGAFPHPSQAQIEAWTGEWRIKLFSDSEFPAIPMFAVGSEDWILETPCNPASMEQEAPGFSEALYAREEVEMLAVLVDSETGIVRKITTVPLSEMLIERLVISWNPFRFGDQYTKTYNEEEFGQRIQEIYKKPSRELWNASW